MPRVFQVFLISERASHYLKHHKTKHYCGNSTYHKLPSFKHIVKFWMDIWEFNFPHEVVYLALKSVTILTCYEQ